MWLSDLPRVVLFILWILNNAKVFIIWKMLAKIVTKALVRNIFYFIFYFFFNCFKNTIWYENVQIQIKWVKKWYKTGIIGEKKRKVEMVVV